MPLIIPDDIEQFTTQGEEVFCHFLRTVAKPDDRYIVWYSPDISDSEPDFILYIPPLTDTFAEGNREVQRNLTCYNLDMIISVGYRIKSNVATHFRQRAKP
jgi:hypothetical protein